MAIAVRLDELNPFIRIALRDGRLLGRPLDNRTISHQRYVEVLDPRVM